MQIKSKEQFSQGNMQICLILQSLMFLIQNHVMCLLYNM